MGVSQNGGTILGVPIKRIMVFWGLYWGPPILGNYHIGDYMGSTIWVIEGDTRSLDHSSDSPRDISYSTPDNSNNNNC